MTTESFDDEDLGLDGPSWSKVAGQAVKARRVELGLTQEEAAVLAGVSTSTWRLVENGQQENFRTLTMAAMSSALGWSPGAIDAMLHGRPAPTTAKPPRQQKGTDAERYFSSVGDDWSEEEWARAEAYIAGLRARRGAVSDPE